MSYNVVKERETMDKDFSCLENFLDFISKRLMQLRNEKDVSAREMSLDIGQNGNYVFAIENKRTLPSMAGLYHICEYMGINPKDFFDVSKTDPEIINKIVLDLKKLNKSSLDKVAGIVETLAEKK